MQNTSNCPYCFKYFDADDPDPDYREGVQCKECWHKYHRICWQNNGRQCMKCGSKEMYSVVLAPRDMVRPPSNDAASASVATNAPDRHPSPPQMDMTTPASLPWDKIAYGLGGLLALSLVLIVLLLMTR